MVWLPDIVLYNNADPKFEKAMDTNVIIKHTGAIMWDQPFIAKSSCQLEVADFPFDEQECPFTVGLNIWVRHRNWVIFEVFSMKFSKLIFDLN